jgi:hypothetical protein
VANGNGDDDTPPPIGDHRGCESDSDSEDDDDVNAIELRHSEIPDDEVYHPDSMTPSVQRMCVIRPRKPRDYSHMYAHATIMHHAMTQYSLKKGHMKFQKASSKE